MYSQVGSTIELSLRDGRYLRLSGPRLALLYPDGTFERSYLLNQIADCNNPAGTWEVFLRLWTNEELTLLAASDIDTNQIVQWASNAPRLQRRAAAQRAAQQEKARGRMIRGGFSLVIGIGLLIFTYHIARPGGYYLVPLGAIGFGGMNFFTGLIHHFGN